MLTDTHTHVHQLYKPDVMARMFHYSIPQNMLPVVIQHARDFGVGRMIELGTDVETSGEAVQIAADYEGVFAGIGLHPAEAHRVTEGDYDRLREMAATGKKIVCLGEIGLDYGEVYGPGIPPRNAPPAPPEVQREVFRRQVRLAKELRLPINVHIRRSSSQDVLDILKEQQAGEVGGVLHQFMANERIAREMFDLGMDIGISQFICDPRADRLRGVVKDLPLEKMVLETDTPAQFPPETDIPGEPMHTRLVAEKLAELKGVSLADIEAITSANVKRIFGI